MTRDIRTRLAEIGTDLDAMEMIDISVLSTLQAGGNPGPISSLLKLRWSEIRQSITELAVDVAGDDALRWIPERPFYETLQLPPEDEDDPGRDPALSQCRAFTSSAGRRRSRPTSSRRRWWDCSFAPTSSAKRR